MSYHRYVLVEPSVQKPISTTMADKREHKAFFSVPSNGSAEELLAVAFGIEL